MEKTQGRVGERKGEWEASVCNSYKIIQEKIIRKTEEQKKWKEKIY